MDFRQFLNHAEQLCQEAANESTPVRQERLIIASILFSWIAMESFVNDMMDDFAALPKGFFTVHERGFLRERRVEFSSKGGTAGQFIATERPDYQRFEDKIVFLVAKIGQQGNLDKGSHLWQRLDSSKRIRDHLTHPRRSHGLTTTLSEAEESLNLCKEIVQLLAQKVWGKKIDF
jgi:hypothetical protein